MGRIRQSIETVDLIIAEHGFRSAQHVLDLTQAAIRRNAPSEELKTLEIMMRMVQADARSTRSGAAEGRASG